MEKIYSYLAIGDSYTIGENVPIAQNFPYQTVQLLRRNGFKFYAPELIATTGWTTDELHKNMSAHITLPQYDFVSLLIGVNNQYRGYSLEVFKKEFEDHLRKALQLSKNQPQNVFVISIPDWGVTPFAEGRDRKKIAAEIDSYNMVCSNTAAKYNVKYIDITKEQRSDSVKEEYIAGDKLHPSGKEYAKWGEKLFLAIKNSLNKK